jgi:hypothetical protein
MFNPHLTTPGGKTMTTHKLMTLPTVLFAMQAFAADAPPATSTKTPDPAMHRYMIERTFPAGALDGVDSNVKRQVNDNNSTVGVRWIQSYANTDKTKTYCIYEGPDEASVRKAAELNKLPVDRITEVPVTLLPR